MARRRERARQVAAATLDRVDDLTATGAWRRRRRWVAGSVEDVANRLHGVAHLLRVVGPEDDVDDDLLRARVASTLGLVRRRLDLPRLHVTVRDRVVTLDGVAGAVADERLLVAAAERVAGVEGVRSRLRLGLEPGDVRPSNAAALRGPSSARRDLEAAAAVALHERGWDVDEAADAGGTAAAAVVRTFLDLLPDDERAHVTAHLPTDVRVRLDAHDWDRWARPGTAPRTSPRTPEGLLDLVADRTGLLPADAARVTSTVLSALRTRVPEEVGDVAAVLPSDLRAAWADPTVLEREAG